LLKGNPVMVSELVGQLPPRLPYDKIFHHAKALLVRVLYRSLKLARRPSAVQVVDPGL
jgi:hypothetical protein